MFIDIHECSLICFDCQLFQIIVIDFQQLIFIVFH